MGSIKRGEIYYIEIPHATGHEMRKSRPGVIISCNALNKSSTVVAVVMCSSSCERDLPEHVTIRATPVLSTAMCEHIYTVDKSRLGKYMGRCSQMELTAIDIGIMTGLGLSGLASPVGSGGECSTASDADQMQIDLVRAETERDTYKSLYERMLDRMTMEKAGGKRCE